MGHHATCTNLLCFDLVTYRLTRGDPSTIDGELTAVEFVPEDWLH